jgi:glycosyltransferase involved in cell wall biosynthesis
MRVLHVIPSVSPVHGGPSKAIVIMEQALSTAGIAVTTATTDDDGPGRRLATHARPPRACPPARVYARKWLDFYKVAPGLVPWLWRHVRDFDVVHIHALFSFTSLAAGLMARGRGVPYVIRPLGTLAAYGMNQRRPWLKRLSLTLVEGPLLRRASAVHFTSQSELDEAASLGIPLRSVVVPLAVEEERPGDPHDLIREHPILAHRRTVLFLSRLDPKKNVESLLQAIAALKALQGEPVLLMAGDGDPAHVASLKTLAASLGIDQSVIWLGHVEGARKAAVLAAADVFVLPSFSENFGLAAAEAMLAGLPCVLARGVAIAGDVQQAGAGLAVVPEPEILARALAQVLGDEALRHDMGARARLFAERTYSTRAMAEGLTALYRRLASANDES